MATPCDSQSIRSVVPNVTRVTLNVLQLNRLSGSLTSFEQGEDVVDEFFVGDWIPPRILPTVFAPVERPLGQCYIYWGVGS